MGRPKKRWQLVYGKDAQLLRIAFVFVSKIVGAERPKGSTGVKEAVRAALKQAIPLYQGLELFRRCPDESEFERIVHSAVYSANQFRPVQRGQDLKVIGRTYHAPANLSSATTDRDRVKDACKKRRDYLVDRLENELQALLKDNGRAREHHALLKSLCRLDKLELGARSSIDAMGKPDVQRAISKSVQSVRKVILEAIMPEDPTEEFVISDPERAFKSIWNNCPGEREELEDAVRRAASRLFSSTGKVPVGMSIRSAPSKQPFTPGIRRIDSLAQEASDGLDFLALMTDD